MCRSCHLGRSAATKSRGVQWKKQLVSCERTMLSAWAMTLSDSPEDPFDILCDTILSSEAQVYTTMNNPPATLYEYMPPERVSSVRRQVLEPGKNTLML